MPDINILGDEFHSYLGAGGEAVQTFVINVPPAARQISYSFMVDGAGNPVTHRLDYMNSFKVTGKDWSNTVLANVYNSATLAEGSNLVTMHGSTHLRWQVQSNAGSANQFGLWIKFLA